MELSEQVEVLVPSALIQDLDQGAGTGADVAPVGPPSLLTSLGQTIRTATYDEQNERATQFRLGISARTTRHIDRRCEPATRSSRPNPVRRPGPASGARRSPYLRQYGH